MCEATNYGPPMWIRHGLNSSKCTYRGKVRKEKCGVRFSDEDFNLVIQNLLDVHIHEIGEKDKQLVKLKDDLEQLRSDFQKNQSDFEVNIIY
jgi:TolA-binding protein